MCSENEWAMRLCCSNTRINGHPLTRVERTLCLAVLSKYLKTSSALSSHQRMNIDAEKPYCLLIFWNRLAKYRKTSSALSSHQRMISDAAKPHRALIICTREQGRIGHV